LIVTSFLNCSQSKKREIRKILKQVKVDNSTSKTDSNTKIAPVFSQTDTVSITPWNTYIPFLLTISLDEFKNITDIKGKTSNSFLKNVAYDETLIQEGYVECKLHIVNATKLKIKQKEFRNVILSFGQGYLNLQQDYVGNYDDSIKNGWMCYYTFDNAKIQFNHKFLQPIEFSKDKKSYKKLSSYVSIKQKYFTFYIDTTNYIFHSFDTSDEDTSTLNLFPNSFITKKSIIVTNVKSVKQIVFVVDSLDSDGDNYTVSQGIHISEADILKPHRTKLEHLQNFYINFQGDILFENE